MFRHHGSSLIYSPNFQRLYTARFIPLFLHLILLILILVYREDLVANCGVDDFSKARDGFVWSDAWTGASLGLVFIEMILSLSGLSIFRHYAVFFSIVFHSTASVLLSAYFMSDISICTGSPYLLFFCTLLPLIVETISWIELFRMTTAVPSSHSSSSPADVPALNSYGSLSHSDDIEVLPSTTIITPTIFQAKESDSTITHRYKPVKTPCLKPHQSETIFAICLFTLGSSLLTYVIVSYWFTHSQISPVIIFICGLLCFIPGCYYLIEHYCFIFKCRRNRHRPHRIIDQEDDIV
ncbi:hypothetical protein I4U23_019547 [Adineta vaga]|nr:hypothetical protein I4U23_019547 [Adineta vaga]